MVERKEESPEEGALESSYQKIQPNKQEIKKKGSEGKHHQFIKQNSIADFHYILS